MPTRSVPKLQAKSKVIRRHIITGTTTAWSGHQTSSLSAEEAQQALAFIG
jgi:transketolase N-terminal domain/subunit